MAEKAEILLFLFFMALAAVLIFLFFSSAYKAASGLLIDLYHNRIRWGRPISHKRHAQINKALQQSVSYYRLLSPNGKTKFINRLVRFLSEKKFIGEKGLGVTDEMRILIAAGAVMLTFGLEKYLLRHYTTIIVYPGKFYAKALNMDLTGATFGNHIIAVSWIDIKKGFMDPNDKLNLALHEMAHALKLDVILGNDFDKHFADHINNWLSLSYEQYDLIKSGKNSFFRNYGGSNQHEFFAVCVENFFEAPENFKQTLPDLYYQLCVLLNQDTTNIHEDYKLVFK